MWKFQRFSILGITANHVEKRDSFGIIEYETLVNVR